MDKVNMNESRHKFNGSRLVNMQPAAKNHPWRKPVFHYIKDDRDFVGKRPLPMTDDVDTVVDIRHRKSDKRK